MTQSELARFLGVRPQQVWSWYKRRATTGFPEPWAYTIPNPGGGRPRAPMFNVTEVVEWYINYDPNHNRGAHWARKRSQTHEDAI